MLIAFGYPLSLHHSVRSLADPPKAKILKVAGCRAGYRKRLPTQFPRANNQTNGDWVVQANTLQGFPFISCAIGFAPPLQ